MKSQAADAGGSLIVQQLLKTPLAWQDRTMFESANGNLSFGAMREGMLRMAGWLIEGAIGPGCRVAVCLPKGLAAAQAIYGILASGAAYVPLDVRGDPAQLASMLASLRPQLHLTTPEMAQKIAEAAGSRQSEMVRTVAIAPERGALERLLSGFPAANALPHMGPDDLAAVFFTSGSSEVPKGVMLSHRNIAADVAWIVRFHAMNESDRRISQGGLHYISSLDLFYPLLSGSRLFLPDNRNAMFADKIAELLDRNKITIWSSTTTELRLLLEHGDLGGRDLSALRRVGFYGEKMPMHLLGRLMTALPHAEFINMYGSTETSEIAHFTVPRPLAAELVSVPLGRPTDICSVSLRDADGNQVASGNVGEICVVGPAVTLGYWDDASLTEAKRVAGQPDSFRTGDLGMIGEDHLLHLVGRTDQVIKLRGRRIDLGEVEAVLKSHPMVRDAVVFLAPASPDSEAIEAIVLAETTRALAAELHVLCLRRLPRLAQPTRIRALPEFPLLPSGKVDRRQLQASARE